MCLQCLPSRIAGGPPGAQALAYAAYFTFIAELKRASRLL
jgi:hypothetical protein